MSGKTCLVVGASRGIGAAVAQHLDAAGHRIVAVSRTRSSIGEWIQADVGTAEGILTVLRGLDGRPLDALLFLGGVWEQHAFTDEYDFLASSDAETRHVIAVNLVAPIELTRGLYPNLRAGSNPRAVFMGSLSGLELGISPEVANAAAKFGLRGAAHALRRALRGSGIGCTVINPGNVATEEVLADIAAGRFPAQQAIPLIDICTAIAWVLGCSPEVDVGEITLMQKQA